MSIYSFIKDDHDRMKDMMARIEAMGDEESDERTALFEELKAVVIAHADAEEQVFYRPLKKYRKVEDDIEHGEEEHDEAKELLEELSDPSLVGAAWAQKFKRFQHELQHHNDEEERDIFPKAHELLSREEAARMEASMRARKRSIKQDVIAAE
jgi:hemerythrin superfamily protein